MRRIPSLIIVANRGHLIAYETSESQTLERIEKWEFPPFNQTNPTELELQDYPEVSAKISEILDRVNARCWGFATPSEINAPILGGIEKAHLDKLAFNLKLDLTQAPPGEVYARFEKAAGQI